MHTYVSDGGGDVGGTHGSCFAGHAHGDEEAEEEGVMSRSLSVQELDVSESIEGGPGGVGLGQGELVVEREEVEASTTESGLDLGLGESLVQHSLDESF